MQIQDWLALGYGTTEHEHERVSMRMQTIVKTLVCTLGMYDVAIDPSKQKTITEIRDDGNFADPRYWNPGPATVRTYELNGLIGMAADGGNGYGKLFRDIISTKIAE